MVNIDLAIRKAQTRMWQALKAEASVRHLNGRNRKNIETIFQIQGYLCNFAY